MNLIRQNVIIWVKRYVNIIIHGGGGFDLSQSDEKTFETGLSYFYEQENDLSYTLYTLEDVNIINLPTLLFAAMFITQEELRKEKIKKILNV